MLYKGLQLDRFQEKAIAAINRDTSVIVTAPTGAGKTVIAEYAVENVLKRTSALSTPHRSKPSVIKNIGTFTPNMGRKLALLQAMWYSIRMRKCC